MDAHVQECTEVCGVIKLVTARRLGSRRCCWGRNEKAAVGRQRLFLGLKIYDDIVKEILLLQVFNLIVKFY